MVAGPSVDPENETTDPKLTVPLQVLYAWRGLLLFFGKRIYFEEGIPGAVVFEVDEKLNRYTKKKLPMRMIIRGVALFYLTAYST